MSHIEHFYLFSNYDLKQHRSAFCLPGKGEKQCKEGGGLESISWHTFPRKASGTVSGTNKLINILFSGNVKNYRAFWIGRLYEMWVGRVPAWKNVAAGWLQECLWHVLPEDCLYVQPCSCIRTVFVSSCPYTKLYLQTVVSSSLHLTGR